MRKVLKSSTSNFKKTSRRFPHLERLAYSLIVFLLFAFTALQGQSIFITSSGGSFPTERYLSISTAVDGGGTTIWEQGDYCGNTGLGNVSDVEVDVTSYCGQTIYVNAYDKYDDSWNGGIYEIWTAVGQTGTLLANNGGASPDDTNDDDDTSAPCDMGQLTELEVSEGFTATACLCTQPTATFTLVPNCPTDFSIEVDVTLNDATGVDISDDDAGTAHSFTNAGAGISTMGPYALGTDVIVTIDGTAYGCASMASSTALTEECNCITLPTATVASSNLDCGTNMYDIMVTVDSDGDGDANMSDIKIDGSVVQADAMLGNTYTFTVALGSHTVTVEAEGAGFVTCVSADYTENMSCNGGDVCGGSVDITNDCSAGDLSSATVDGGALVQNYISCGNGTTIALCGANSGFTGSSYVRTDHTDIWYAVTPNGSNEVTITISNLAGGNIMVLPYLTDGTCPTASSANDLLEDHIGNLSLSITNDQCPFFTADGTLVLSGTPLTTATTVYLRIMPYALNGSGATNCETLTYPTFDICASVPQANDICGDAITMDNVTVAGDLCAAGTETENTETGATCAESQDTPDLWYEVTMDGADSDQTLEVDLTFSGAADAVVVELYHNCFTNTFLECATVSSTGAASTVTHMFNSVLSAGGFGPTYYVRVTAASGNSVCDFEILGRRIAENNNCDVMQTPFPGFDIEGAALTEMNFNYATPSGAIPTIAGNDLWFHFDTNQETDPSTGLITASTTSEVIIYGDAGVEYSVVLYKGNGLSSNNCADLAADYLETINVSPNGSSNTIELACLDELHLSTDGGYILRVVQTAGPTSTNGGVRTETQPAGPYNNDCENIWNGSGPTILGATGEDATTSFNPFVILPGFSNYRSGDFENSTDCHPDIASAVCNGIDQQAIASNEDRDLWYIVTVPDLVGACDLAMSETITGVTFLYNAGDQTEDAVLYLYDGCNDSNLIGCSGSLDGAPSGAGDAQFDDPQSTWTVSDLVQGNSYLLRVKPHDISNNGNGNEFDFDISWKTADPSPCNDDPANAEALSLGCYSYSSLDTWSAQGATETAPVDGAPESDVWFSFTAPAANGGSYTTTESWASVFFENVSGHNLYLDIYNTTSTSPTVTTYESGGSAGDQGWGIFGNLDPGETYYLRLYHKELSTVNVQYKIAVNDGPVTEPGWGCGSNSQTMINECASGCKDLREVFFKIDLPTDAPTDSYWAIEVTGMDQDLDFELRSQYNNGQTTYVVGATGVDGALEGGAHDYDHPCSSVALESAVTISSTTTDIDGCDGNDSLGDIDPALTSQGSDGNSDIGSGVRRVYHDMNGPGSASMKDYYFVRVFIDPSDTRYAEWAEVKICDVSFKGPYSTAALADAGGTPDRNCDPVTCDITNVVVSNDNTCNGDDATFTVTFDVAEGGGTYEVYDTDTNLPLGATTAAADATGVTINVTVTGPTVGTTINVDVRDQATTACNGGTPQAAILATCPNTTVAVDDFNNTPEGVTVTGNALDNDYDPQGDTQDVTTTITTDPTKGTVTIDAMGNYTYIPTAGQTGEDSFEYTVCDDQTPEACDIATVYIEIIADPINGNNPPIADADYALTEVDTPVTGSLISNDNDPDGDDLVINTTPISGPTNGTLTINPDGTYEYTPNSMFVGMEMFSYEVCDDGTPSMCDIATVTIDIIADNGNITSAADDSGVGLVNETISGSLTDNDTDPEGDTQTINTTPVVGPGVAGATVTINTDGTYDYVPATDYVGNDEFMYEICDDAMPTMACVTATVHITILPGKPNLTYAVDDFNHTLVDVAVMGSVISNDFDPEGDNQVVSILLITPPSNGAVTINALGEYTYTPASGYSGDDSFEYEVCDDDMTMEACDIATVYITVIPDPVSGNDAPVANPDYSLTEVNTPILGNMISNDNDPDGDPLTVNTTPQTMPTNGTVIIYPNGTYLYTPNTDYIGSDEFSYEVCDADNVCDIATVSIDVLPDTGNITGASDDSGIGVLNTNISGDLLDNDTDPEGDAQTINTTPVTAPTNGTVTIYPDGSYDYVPASDFVGNDEFTYEVCDNGDPQACKVATVYLTVLDVKEDPEYTIAFNTDGTSYLNGASKDGYYLLENIGEGESLEGIALTFTIPNPTTFTTTFDQTMTTTNVGGGTLVDNSKFTYTFFANFIFATLKPGEKIASDGNLKIGFTFTAIGSPLSTAGSTGQVQSFTAGDIIETNNYAQGSFRIN